MGIGASRALKLRIEAWAYGRGQRDKLLRRYCQEYGLHQPPPPARCVDELLTDFLGAKLCFDPLPLDRFAQTQVRDGRTIVTVNALTNRIVGVKDVDGVQNVAKWHETIHVIDDQGELRHPPKNMLPGFGDPPATICLRAGERPRSNAFDRREFWAEEAGRAAAVSHNALGRSLAFRSFLAAAATDAYGEVRNGWPRLYDAATDIGVNISALVKQLELDGRLSLVRVEHGPSRLFVPPSFVDRTGGTW